MDSNPIPSLNQFFQGFSFCICLSCSRTSLPSPPLLFIAFSTLHRSPLSERLEQAIMRIFLAPVFSYTKTCLPLRWLFMTATLG